MQRFLTGFRFIGLAIADYRSLLAYNSGYVEGETILKGIFYNSLNGKL